MKVRNRIVFDIDSKSEDNLRSIKNYYEKLLQIQFRIFRTNGGYHLFSEKYQPDKKVQLEYDQCRVLQPLLEKPLFCSYIDEIKRWYNEKCKEMKCQDKKGRMKDEGIKEFLESGLCTYPVSFDFDILFSMNVIRKGYYVIRISKKNENDQPVEVFMSLKNHIEDEIAEIEIHDCIYIYNYLKNRIKNHYKDAEVLEKIL